MSDCTLGGEFIYCLLKVTGRNSYAVIKLKLHVKEKIIMFSISHIPGPIQVPLYMCRFCMLTVTLNSQKNMNLFKTLLFKGNSILSIQWIRITRIRTVSWRLLHVSCTLRTLCFFFWSFEFVRYLTIGFRCSQTITPGFNWGLYQARKSQRIT